MSLRVKNLRPRRPHPLPPPRPHLCELQSPTQRVDAMPLAMSPASLSLCHQVFTPCTSALHRIDIQPPAIKSEWVYPPYPRYLLKSRTATPRALTSPRSQLGCNPYRQPSRYYKAAMICEKPRFFSTASTCIPLLRALENEKSRQHGRSRLMARHTAVLSGRARQSKTPRPYACLVCRSSEQCNRFHG
jgi:hypothetical protein